MAPNKAFNHASLLIWRERLSCIRIIRIIRPVQTRIDSRCHVQQPPKWLAMRSTSTIFCTRLLTCCMQLARRTRGLPSPANYRTRDLADDSSSSFSMCRRRNPSRKPAAEAWQFTRSGGAEPAGGRTSWPSLRATCLGGHGRCSWRWTGSPSSPPCQWATCCASNPTCCTLSASRTIPPRSPPPLNIGRTVWCFAHTCGCIRLLDMMPHQIDVAAG